LAPGWLLPTAPASGTLIFRSGSNSKRIPSSDEGIQIDESEEQDENASLSTRESLEPDSNDTVERASHSEKQWLQSLSTEGGMAIDESDEHVENTECSRQESREPDSKLTTERERQSAKHNWPSVSTEEGMQIDESDEQCENTQFSMQESFEPGA
jgi:hypothetical protein